MPSSNSGEAEKSQVGPHGDSVLSPGEVPTRPTVVKKDVVEKADQAVGKDALVAVHTDTQAQTQAGDTQIKTPGSKIDNSADPVVAKGDGGAAHTDTQAYTQADGTQIKTQVSRNANSVDPVVASGAGVAAHTGTQVQSQVGDTQTKTTGSKTDNSVDPVVARDNDVAVCDDTQAKTQVCLIDKTVLEPENSDDQGSGGDMGLNSTANTSDLTKNFQNVTLGPNMPSVQDMAQSMMLEPTMVQTTNNVQNDASDASVGQTENNGQNKTLEPMEITISEENKAIDDQEGRESQSGDAESTDSEEFENTDQQRDGMITEASPASEKKRKRRTKKKDFKDKREKKREKLAGKKVDDNTSQSVASNEVSSIQKHEFLVPIDKHQNDEVATSSTSITKSDSEIFSHPSDNTNSLNVGNGGNKGKVFGGYADSNTATKSTFEVRYPPSDHKSLFELDTKIKDTKGVSVNEDNKISKSDSKAGENIGSAQESTTMENENFKTTVKRNTTGNGSTGKQPGVQTRSQAKNNQNSQKTTSSDDKNKKVGTV